MDCLLVGESRGPLVGAGPSFEEHVDETRERQALVEVAYNLDVEAD